MFEIDPPRSKASIAAALSALQGEITQYLQSFPAEEFLTPQGEYWSPSEHLSHLVTAVRPVAIAFGMPKAALALRFGIALRPSRPFDGVVALYRQALAEGGRAAGPFLPKKRPEGTTPEAWRQSGLERWEKANRDLLGHLDRWSERALDRFVVRHPLPTMGRLTLREILFFTLYHNAHHARRIQERR